MSNPINNPSSMAVLFLCSNPASTQSSMAEFTPFQTQTPVNVSLLKPPLSIATDIT